MNFLKQKYVFVVCDIIAMQLMNYREILELAHLEIPKTRA